MKRSFMDNILQRFFYESKSSGLKHGQLTLCNESFSWHYFYDIFVSRAFFLGGQNNQRRYVGHIPNLDSPSNVSKELKVHMTPDIWVTQYSFICIY